MGYKGQDLFIRRTGVVLCGSKAHAMRLATILVDRPRLQDLQSFIT